MNLAFCGYCIAYSDEATAAVDSDAVAGVAASLAVVVVETLVN